MEFLFRVSMAERTFVELLREHRLELLDRASLVMSWSRDEEDWIMFFDLNGDKHGKTYLFESITEEENKMVEEIEMADQLEDLMNGFILDDSEVLEPDLIDTRTGMLIQRFM